MPWRKDRDVRRFAWYFVAFYLAWLLSGFVLAALFAGSLHVTLAQIASQYAHPQGYAGGVIPAAVLALVFFGIAALVSRRRGRPVDLRRSTIWAAIVGVVIWGTIDALVFAWLEYQNYMHVNAPFFG